MWLRLKQHNFLLVVAILTTYPASPQVLVVGKDIVGSSAVTCTALEKAELKLAETSLTEAKEFLEEALEVAQANLLDATGSTLSASQLLEFTTASATTKASRFRMRGFQRQLLKQ